MLLSTPSISTQKPISGKLMEAALPKFHTTPFRAKLLFPIPKSLLSIEQRTWLQLTKLLLVVWDHTIHSLPEISPQSALFLLAPDHLPSPFLCYVPGSGTRSWFGCRHRAAAQTYCSADVPMPNPFTLSYTVLSEIQHHMHLNKLLFNVSKPDLLVAHTPSALKNCTVPSLSQPVQKVEVQFDSTLSFDQRVSHICKVSFQLQNLF